MSRRRYLGEEDPQPKLLQLPEIARNPNAFLTPRKKILAQAQRPPPVSPYLRKGDPLLQTMVTATDKKLHIPKPPPPVNAAEQPESDDKNEDRADDDAADDEQDLNDVVPSELTLTYLKVVVRSESFYRRALDRSRSEYLQYMQRPWAQLQQHVARIVEEQNIRHEHETAERDEIDKEEQKERQRLAKMEGMSRQIAKRNEDIRPGCPLIAKGHSVHLDPECENALVAELRWRGGDDINVFVVISDAHGEVLHVASRTQSVKGQNNVVAVRHFGNDSSFKRLGIGGTRDCYQLCVANLTRKATTVSFVALHSHNGKEMLSFERGWFTLYQPKGRTSDSWKELYACGIAPGSSAISAVALAKITITNSDILQFHALSETLAGVASPRQAHLLQAEPADVSFNRQLALSRERLIVQSAMVLVDAVAKTIELQESEERNALKTMFVQQKPEVKTRWRRKHHHEKSQSGTSSPNESNAGTV